MAESGSPEVEDKVGPAAALLAADDEADRVKGCVLLKELVTNPKCATRIALAKTGTHFLGPSTTGAFTP